MRRPGPPAAPGVTGLVELIRRRDAPLLLVLDDVHHLHRAPVPDLLVELATRLPAGSQLAVASRSRTALRLGRLRAERRCAEFGPADLAFDADEAADVLTLAGVDASKEDVHRLLERTEGWPAGIYLAAVALRERVDLAAAPAKISGSDAYIVDFFRDELMVRESPETVRFLLRTAVLGQLSAALCDAVLDTTGSAARLAEIERRNLFLVPLDHHREWYRYHRLFAETLVAELRRREPGEEQRVHRRAARWYESTGRGRAGGDVLDRRRRAARRPPGWSPAAGASSSRPAGSPPSGPGSRRSVRTRWRDTRRWRSRPRGRTR